MRCPSDGFQPVPKSSWRGVDPLAGLRRGGPPGGTWWRCPGQVGFSGGWTASTGIAVSPFSRIGCSQTRAGRATVVPVPQRDFFPRRCPGSTPPQPLGPPRSAAASDGSPRRRWSHIAEVLMRQRPVLGDAGRPYRACSTARSAVGGPFGHARGAVRAYSLTDQWSICGHEYL